MIVALTGHDFFTILNKNLIKSFNIIYSHIYGSYSECLGSRFSFCTNLKDHVPRMFHMHFELSLVVWGGLYHLNYGHVFINYKILSQESSFVY